MKHVTVGVKMTRPSPLERIIKKRMMLDDLLRRSRVSLIFARQENMPADVLASAADRIARLEDDLRFYGVTDPENWGR